MKLIRVDGSRFTITELKDEWDIENKHSIDSIVWGIYTEDNYMSINPYCINEENIDKLCFTISHEFLHMLLRKQFGDKVCTLFDNVLDYNEVWTDCGGL